MQTRSNSYDEVPYEHLPFSQTHPDRLATVARLFGLAPPPVATSRVLELGCASGGNLIPMAFNLPQAELVGVDLSLKQVQAARDIVGALGIRNVDIRHASILDIDTSWGQFDFIICHGVFSWVEADVQDKILRVSSEQLASNGIAYISYNTYPGWHMREMVRDMMRYHAGPFDDPREQIEQARALLDFLASAAERHTAYGQLLRLEIERLSQTTDSYLYHEHLEPTNAPTYFHQFIERAERAGLQFLSEADVSDMLSSVFPATVAETLERISPDILHLEQYMDFVRNRQFRQTLLCHREMQPKRALSPAVMHGLKLSCRAVTTPFPPDLTSMHTVVFRNDRQHAEVALPATKAAFTVLMERWPHATDIDELCAIALERAAPFLSDSSTDEARRSMMADLFWGVMRGMVGLHTTAIACTNRPGGAPRANALAAYHAQLGRVVVNARHEMVELDALGREVLKLATGDRSQSEIVEALAERVESGTLTLRPAPDQPLADGLRPRLEAELERTLTSLTRNALFVE